MKRRVWIYSVGIILTLIATLFFIRLFSERHLDDVSLGIDCEEKLLKKADIFYVIPKFKSDNISDNKGWCRRILSLNKKLALHGVTHEYEEFLTDRDESYLQKGIDIFEECFGFSPERFKPPQLAVSENNKKMIKEKMKLDAGWTIIFHKVYHCGNSGMIPNWFMDFF